MGTGSSAVFNFESVPGVATTFDHNSMQFTAPATQFNDGTTDYDKYLLFPKYNIVDSLPNTNNIVLWYNNYGDFVNWANDAGNSVVWTNTNT